MRALALALVLFSGCLQAPFGGGDEKTPWMPDCAGSAFDASPLAFDAFTSITPLGNLNPPEHTLPTDHIYFILQRVPDTQTTVVADLFAPGAVRITNLARSTMWKDGALAYVDYQIEFAACGGVTGRFGHVSSLAADIEGLAANRWGDCNRYGDAPRGVEYEHCNARVNHDVVSGSRLGTSGGQLSAGLDMWSHDADAARLVHANPARYRTDAFTVVCPLDHFSKGVRDTLRSMLGDHQRRRTEEPVCGEVAQDAPGTAQGNWFVGDVEADTPESWRNSVALVHENANPNVGVFSIGGPLESGKWSFEPRHEGTVNRDFDEVAPGRMYCYETGGDRFLVELPDATRLKLERQNGTCGSVAFTNPTAFER